jgi:hypothetical protein
VIIGVRAHGHAAFIWRAGRDAGQEGAPPASVRCGGGARSKGGERGIVPWLTDGSRRSVKERRGKRLAGWAVKQAELGHAVQGEA